MQTSPSLERMTAPSRHDDTDSGSAVSWSSIFGGAAAAVALTFVLLSLGSGFGWSSALGHEHAAGPHFKYMVAVWLVLTQWISSALGGYLTGRLRTKWHGVHTHEVFFRDTAHGFLVWCVATILYTGIVSFAASSGAHMMHGSTPGEEMHNGMATGPEFDFLDSLFRSNSSGPAMDRDTRMEASHIIWKGARTGLLSPADESYLAQLVSTRTGASTEDATKEIDTTVADLHQSVVSSEKASASLAIFTCLSMLIGAFIACVGAALGGMERDMPRPLED